MRIRTSEHGGIQESGVCMLAYRVWTVCTVRSTEEEIFSPTTLWNGGAGGRLTRILALGTRSQRSQGFGRCNN